jgi:signal transduction histidine kinase
MKRLIGNVLRDKRGVFCNPHFWIILVIILVLTFIYYLDFFFINLMDPKWHFFWRLVYFEFRNNLNGGLFCIPLIYAAIVFWWRGILITGLISVALILPRIKYYSPTPSSLVVNIILLLIPLLVVVILALQRKWRETERKAAEEREEERQTYIAQIFKAQEDERKRISREIHDDTTQRLWIVANRVQKLADDGLRSIAPQTSAELEGIKDTILGISADARRLSLALRPGILDDLGLVPAIRWIVDQLNCESPIEAKIFINGFQRELNHEIKTHLFRIAQESLNNVRRHSEATKAAVELEFKPDSIKMIVWDNGKGFISKNLGKLSKKDKLGLIGIQERVRLLNGILKINSKRGKGTNVSVELKY